jgi:hypothetical protein
MGYMGCLGVDFGNCYYFQTWLEGNKTTFACSYLILIAKLILTIKIQMLDLAEKNCVKYNE